MKSDGCAVVIDPDDQAAKGVMAAQAYPRRSSLCDQGSIECLFFAIQAAPISKELDLW